MSSLLANEPSSGNEPSRGKVRMMPRTEEPLSTPQPLSASLTLASGSRAGMVVTLHSGFYLIGRNSDCQVRPKSRSVSRRHCLIRHQEGQLQVLDLDSTSGTRLNGEKMEPRLWYPLADGDELRCGKIAFAVAAVAVESTAEGAAELPVGGTSGQAAWQAEDIADWMTDFDQLEQAERIQTLRTQTVSPKSDPQADTHSATDTDAAAARDTTLPGQGPASSSRSEKRSSARPPKSRSQSAAARGVRWPSWGLPAWNVAVEGERWKTVMATLLFVAAVVWLLVSLFYLGDDNVYQQVKTLET